MKLIFLIVCLVIVVITLENLIVSGFHARTHRLLPLVLGLVALYDFYLIVENITGQTETFYLLKQLLLIQFLDVLLYFILDFMRIRISMIYNVIIVSILIFMDVLIFTHAKMDKTDYRGYVAVFVIVSVIGLVTLVILKSPNKKQISKQTRHNNHVMGLTLFIPSVALVVVELNLADADILLPLAVDVSCVILDYLFLTDRLREVDIVLKEEHFHTLDIPAFLFDTDFFFLDASNKARELFEKEIEAVSLSPKYYALQEQIEQIRSDGGVSYREIDGRFYRCELQNAEYKGKLKGYILTFMDITDQKKETDMAKELAKQKSEFLANMSHDLRSPLHAIIGSSEVALSRGDMTSKSREMVNYIHEAGINLLDIVNSILDFSKLESGELKLFPQKYDFKTLVEDQARLGYINLRDSNVSLSVEIPNPYPQYIYGDKLRVRQIIQNLLSNAIKFTNTGAICVTFDINIENDNKVRIIYSVKDSGVGLTEEQMETVFGDYVTFAQEQKKEGTGLGLSIVKKLCEMMDGNVSVESDGKNGATFTASFCQELVNEDIIKLEKDGIDLSSPLFIRNESDISDESVWNNTVAPNYIYPGAEILLADDMAVNCEIFKSLSEPWKFKLDIARNGAEAVTKAREKTYDLIFLDQMMPVMTGLEAADEMHKCGINTPMILLSANITESMKSSSREHGFTAFMNKPIDTAQLKINIELYLPEDLRNPVEASVSKTGPADITKSEGYLKALKTYVAEMEVLYELLPGYMENDLNMFRNKVHGIKGVSRQLGLRTIADYAEIMEMAVVSDHQPFIKQFFDTFMEELQYAIEKGKKTLMRSCDAEKTEESFDEPLSEHKEPADPERINELLIALKNSLSDYELQLVDDAISELDKMVLPNEIQTAYNQAKAFYEDMEYEDAMEALASLDEI